MDCGASVVVVRTTKYYSDGRYLDDQRAFGERECDVDDDLMRTIGDGISTERKNSPPARQ